MRIQPNLWCDLRIELNGWQVAGFSAGPDELVYVLLQQAGSSKKARRTVRPWRVLAVGREICTTQDIPHPAANFSFVQPVPQGFLLAASRCHQEPNAVIFDSEGKPQYSLMLGDAIAHLQTTESGEVWAGYFDEGIFGGTAECIGASGLTRFSANGDRVFEFQPPAGLQPIFDCYALNIASKSEAWACYYSDFALVKIVNDRAERYWPCPIEGAHAFAVWRDVVLMKGGYHRHDEWNLLSLQSNGKVTTEWSGRLDAGPTPPPNTGIFETARGPNFWYLNHGIVFHIDLKTVI